MSDYPNICPTCSETYREWEVICTRCGDILIEYEDVVKAKQQEQYWENIHEYD